MPPRPPLIRAQVKPGDLGATLQLRLRRCHRQTPKMQHRSSREADVVGAKINRAVVRRHEGRNSKPRDYPGSLPLEAALRNCRRILRQSERKDAILA